MCLNHKRTAHPRESFLYLFLVLFQLKWQLLKINLSVAEDQNLHLVLIAGSWKCGIYTILCYAIEQSENAIS